MISLVNLKWCEMTFHEMMVQQGYDLKAISEPKDANRSLVLFSNVPEGTAQDFVPTESLSKVLGVSRYS